MRAQVRRPEVQPQGTESCQEQGRGIRNSHTGRGCKSFGTLEGLPQLAIGLVEGAWHADAFGYPCRTVVARGLDELQQAPPDVFACLAAHETYEGGDGEPS